MLYALVVVYNKHCDDSKTLRSLRLYDNDIKIIIFDNSKQNFGNDLFCKDHGYKYFGFGENLGLSKAYNYAINHTEKCDDDFLIILDDDTDLTESYFNEVMAKTVGKTKYDILLPIVISNSIILSPSNIKFGCGSKLVNKKKELDLNRLTAINSGMVVRARIYKMFQYNEELFLDCVDHDFMKNVRQHNVAFGLLDSTIIQNYSRTEKPEVQTALFRFNIYKRDFKIYCSSCGNMTFYYLSMLKHIVSQSLKYRSFEFIRSFL